jgi:hypothetical protein
MNRTVLITCLLGGSITALITVVLVSDGRVVAALNSLNQKFGYQTKTDAGRLRKQLLLIVLPFAIPCLLLGAYILVFD